MTADAFLKTYRAVPGVSGESAFYTWIYRISINTANNYLAARSRRPPEADVDPSEAEQYETAPELRDYATPERLALRAEIEHAVVSAIEELPEELKTAITLRELEGLSYEEIAQTVDCPIGTVRSRIFRAREAINGRLEPLLN